MWKKRIRVVVERRRRVVEVQVSGAFCARCAREVETLSREEAAGFLQIGVEEVNSLGIAGSLHFLPSATGVFRVCKQSLLRHSS